MGIFFGRVDASMMINQHRHHHSIASFFSALRGPIKEVKKRKTFKISLRIHPAYFPTARLTASATKRWICVVDVVAKAREIEEEEKIFSANHSKLKLNKILEDLFYITAHNLRTLQLRREQFHRSRLPTMAAWVNHPQIFTWLYK